MKKFLQGFCFVVALVFVFFLYQSVNANVLTGHVEKVQGRTCSCGGTLVVRSKMLLNQDLMIAIIVMVMAII